MRLHSARNSELTQIPEVESGLLSVFLPTEVRVVEGILLLFLPRNVLFDVLEFLTGDDKGTS